MNIIWRVLGPPIVGALLFWVASGGAPVPAQAAGLSAEATEAMQYGVAAAKQQEWELAIKYFDKAREAAPYAPNVLFNLALAHDNKGSHELIAIAWFRAFLAAAPGAANAEQVRGRIVALKVKAEANIAKLIAKAEEAAEQIDLNELYRNTSGQHAAAYIASAQAEVGDFAAAIATAERILDAPSKHEAYSTIVELQAEAGDISGAQATLARIPDDYIYGKYYRYLDIAIAQGKAGDSDAAHHSIALAKEDAVNYSEADYGEIASAQAGIGHIDHALETAANILDDEERSGAYSSMAVAQAETGDIAAAMDTAERTLFYSDQYSAHMFIAIGQVEAGDIAGGKAIAAQIPDERGGSVVYKYIALAQAKAGDLTGARQSVALVEQTESRISIGGEPDISMINLFIAEVQEHGEAAAQLPRYDEIDTMADMVEYGLSDEYNIYMQDLPELIRSLATEQPREAIVTLALAAKAWAEKLKEL